MKYVKFGPDYASIPEFIGIVFIGCLFIYATFFICPHMSQQEGQTQSTTDSTHHRTNPGINAHHIFHK